MNTITLEQAQAQLGELISRLSPGEEVVIAQQGQPLARLVRSELSTWPCQAGSAKEKILWIAPDFDAPLEDFREYME